jgi:hypothetical protein
VLEAFGLGLLAQSSLLLAGLLVIWIEVPRRVVGVLAGFGAGALLSAISFDLVAEAQALESWQLALWMLVGVGVFVVGDYVAMLANSLIPFAYERASSLAGVAAAVGFCVSLLGSS